MIEVVPGSRPLGKTPVALAVLVAMCVAVYAAAQTIQPPYNGSYAFSDLGTITGLPTNYGGLTFKLGDPNVILIGGSANNAAGALYSVPVTRGAQSHITALGSATLFSQGAYNDGSFARGPYVRFPFATEFSAGGHRFGPGMGRAAPVYFESHDREGPMEAPEKIAWRARGLLFENCNCQLVCPGHMHFDQLCTHERCVGFWAIRIDQGSFGDVSLGGVKAVIAYDSPKHMIDGNWTEVIVIDRAASAAQRRAVEAMLTGSAGGPWAVLARFVGRRLDTRFLPVELADEGNTKRARIPGLLEAAVTQIRGRDRGRPVLFQNIFNQIHDATQVLATGTTEYGDGVIKISTSRTHGLFSNFDWVVEAS